MAVYEEAAKNQNVHTLERLQLNYMYTETTVLSRYYDTYGIPKKYRYIQTIVVTVEVPKQCPEARIFARHCNNWI
jgi:hypothetical protein